ncbi:ankyrin repeat-containing domain protein [Lasiosphaeris hirsuta]|uniref:Ankyrin repeat-containing domain protein n=1 Tax=Lasiosphaeris hirsuta TaxID=260670 RepID=A0AA40ANX3_9PEZI|nr:ankyrin repeat-containing domain protein [Lasiosphaeris hirsuta]
MNESARYLTMAAEFNNATAELFIHRVFEALGLSSPILRPGTSPEEAHDDTQRADDDGDGFGSEMVMDNLGDIFRPGNYNDNENDPSSDETLEKMDHDNDDNIGRYDDDDDDDDDDDGGDGDGDGDSDDDDTDEDDGYTLFHLGGALHQSLLTSGEAAGERYCSLIRKIYHHVIAEGHGHVPLISENGERRYKNIEDPALARDSLRLLRQQHSPVVLYRMNDGTYMSEDTLHLAAVCGAVELIQLLLDHGADINEHDMEGSTPLYCSTRHGQAAATRLLVSRGADASAKTPSGHCAIHNLWVFESSVIPEIARLLVDAGAEVNAVSHLNLADALCQQREQGSALHVSVAMRSLTAVESVLEQGADVNLRPPKFLYTPLELASHYHFPEIVDLLLHHGASIYLPAEQHKGWALHAVAHAMQPMLR